MEDWAVIRRLAAEGIPHARIAERLGISRTTVIKAVRSTDPPNCSRRSTATFFVTFEPRVRALLADFSDIPSSVLAERVGWTGSLTWFREIAARICRREGRPCVPRARQFCCPRRSSCWAARCRRRSLPRRVGFPGAMYGRLPPADFFSIRTSTLAFRRVRSGRRSCSPRR